MGFEDLLNIPSNVSPADYRKDGILYCYFCKTPKEFELDGKLRPIMCKCAKAEQVQEEHERKERERQDRISDNIRHGIPDAEYREWTFDHDDMANPKATAIAKRYVEEWAQNKAQNKGLLFVGNVGVGKSYLAVAIANALLQQGVTVMVTSLPKLLRRAYDFEDDVFSDIKRYGLVIIDDIGVERQSKDSLTQIYEIINSRYECRKPLITTSNLTPQEMAEEQDDAKYRIYSRILGMCCTEVIMTGADRRLKIRKDKQKA